MTEHSNRLPSYKATIDSEPWEFYDRLRDAGDVVWDDEMNALLIGSYDLVRGTLLQDKRLFRRPRSEQFENDPVMRALTPSPRDIMFTHGDEHARFHRWWLQALSPGTVARWRPTRIRPIIDLVIDRFATHGRAELVSEFARVVPIRVIASILALPWEDDAWIDKCQDYMDARTDYIEALYAEPADMEEIAQRAVKHAVELTEMLQPFAQRYLDGDAGGGDDMTSMYAASGPELFPDWNIDDMVSGIMTAFLGGSDTTAVAVANGLYHLMTHPELQGELRAGGEEAIEAFVEESLRIYGVAHFVTRIANKDTEIDGVPVKEGAVVMPLLGAANLDPRRYPCPFAVDFARERKHDHTAFLRGPRTCGGLWLARGELAEMYTAVLERLSDLRLDPEAPPPRMEGYVIRRYQPLHALFGAP